MPHEENLGGQSREIIRDDIGVHRPAGWWTPATQDLLRNLNDKGFSYAPKPLGYDKEGKEVISFIEGESGVAGWGKIVSEAGLVKFAKLLRKYHDSVRDYKPEGLEWVDGHKNFGPCEIICHGDFGPWNIIWKGAEPVGLVDWDMARPASPEFDILYAIEYSAPIRSDKEAISWHHFSSPPNRKRRIEVFLEAYGYPPISHIATKIAKMQNQTENLARYLGNRGIEPQATWLKDGTIEKSEARAEWTLKHSYLFE